MVEEFIRDMIDRFNAKAAADPEFEKELRGLKKLVMVQVTDGDTFSFTLENSRIGPLSKSAVQNADITIIGSTEVFNQLKSGELRPMKAYALRKLQVKGSLEDILRLRKFF